jgi:hypothetical protein
MLCILVMLSSSAFPKRVNPKPVQPVEASGIRYSAEGDGTDQYVIATDLRTGKELWKVLVFHTRVSFWLEEDVQWVFITDLKVSATALLSGMRNRVVTPWT